MEDRVRAEADHREHLLLGERLRLVREPSLLDDGGIEVELALSALDDLLLHRALNHKPVHDHLASLADPVRAIHRLQVHLRVPVAVEQDHRVGGGEVDPEPARARREEENERVRVGAAEAVDGGLAKVAADRPVEPLVRVAPLEQVVREDVEHAHHLRKDEHAVPLAPQLGQKLVEEHALARGGEELVDRRCAAAVRGGRLPLRRAQLVRRVRLDALDQVGVVAALAQLHLQVDKRG
mmetsp:Transcript_34656/g.115829  ORF Transcript_34656/g.115829 Transcript_34656/m.115829 type:complete len:237 (+) Transcript_34656:433-1143(+)